MKNKLRKLPVGIQSFEDIRNNNYIYVDKTEHIYNLINNGKIYFLSRPRRFGKSLLVHTLKELFKGNEKLFEDTFIYDKWDWTEKYPVISLSMAKLENETSIFSGLNNTIDISLNDKYSTICGYTKEELKNYFNDHLNKCSKINNKENIESLIKEIDDWYDGYSWDGQSFVYNPWSVLNLFYENIFDNYWFESGTPSFLIKIIEEQTPIEEELLKSQTVTANVFSDFKLKNLNLTATLMQTGYLTIKKRTEFDGRYEYTLDIPNKEVRESLFTYILSIYTVYDIENITTIINEMRKQLKNLDNTGFNNSINELLAEIPNILHQNADDYYYQSVFIAWFIGMGFKIDSEVLTNIGRIDSVIKINDFIVICEIKHDNKISHDKLLKEALDQIKDKEYYEKYLKRNKKIIFLAIAFNNKKAKTVIEEL
jgi:hypothetical protein